MNRKLEILIPKELSEITLGQYQNYALLSEGVTDLARLSEISVISFCNISLENLRLLSSSQVNEIVEKISVVIEKFDEPQLLIKKFRLRGEEYGFIPNLDNITYGENRDILAHLKDGLGSMHKTMAVLYRPTTEQTFAQDYAIDKYAVPVPHQKLFREMPLDVVLGAQVFFYNLIKELLAHIPKYLRKEMGEEKYRELIQKVSTKQIGGSMTNFIT